MTPIDDYVAALRERGVAFAVARLKAGVVEQLDRPDRATQLSGPLFLEVDDGVEAFRNGTFGRLPGS